MSQEQGLNFCIVGCGGVGSRLAPELSKQYPKSRILFIDGDAFEEKNLDRQMFPPEFLGTNKAEAMAKMYGGEAITDMLYDTTPVPDWVDIMFVAVDNNAARRAALSIADNSDIACIVCANEEVEAQSYWYDKTMRGSQMDPRSRYPNLQEDAARAHTDCVAAALSSDEGSQTPLANLMAAAFGLSLLYANTKFASKLNDDGKSHVVLELHTNGNTVRFVKPIDFARVNGTSNCLIN